MSADDDAVWDDLMERLEQASRGLRALAVDHPSDSEADRLVSKASGVALALDYMRGYS